MMLEVGIPIEETSLLAKFEMSPMPNEQNKTIYEIIEKSKKSNACPDLLFSCLTLLKKKTKSYKVIENINLKKSNIKIENQ